MCGSAANRSRVNDPVATPTTNGELVRDITGVSDEPTETPSDAVDRLGEQRAWALADVTDTGGLRIEEADDDDPILIGADGVPVDTWRQGYPYRERLDRVRYEHDKRLLQIELLKLQNWIAGPRRHDAGEVLVLRLAGRAANQVPDPPGGSGAAVENALGSRTSSPTARGSISPTSGWPCTTGSTSRRQSGSSSAAQTSRKASPTSSRATSRSSI